MPALNQITPLILTLDEAPNISRTLSRLTWAPEILVVDSFSSDETLDIARQCPQVHVLQRRFDSFAEQCNFGLQHVRTEWVLSLDADYVLSDELIREVGSMDTPAHVTGYSARFVYYVHGHALRASIYPPRTVLYRKANASYRNEGHGHRVGVQGHVYPLRGRIFHDDRKPLTRWYSDQIKYAAQEARHLSQASLSELSRMDRLRRKLVFAPPMVAMYTLLAKRLILDGWAGWYYVCQRTLAEILLSLELAEHKLRASSEPAPESVGQPTAGLDP